MHTDRTRMEEVAGTLPTKSAKIRALSRAGFARADIARFLGIRYQHVRNVLTQKDPERPSSATVEQPSEEPLPRSRTTFRLIADQDGLTVPFDALRAAGVGAGDVVVAHVEGDQITLTSAAASMRRAQDLVAALIPSDESLAQSLLDSRRREAEQDLGGG